jgi:nucleoside-diphosphate kinase
MASQRTFVILKPDAVQRGLVGDLLARFERKGLRLVALTFLKVDAALAARHYQEHQGKPFFPNLIGFITSSPVVALALEGDEAIAVVRNLVGPTDGRKAPPGTIRGDYGLSNSNNLVHASDGPESAARELALWFPEGFVDWTPCRQPWIQGG